MKHNYSLASVAAVDANTLEDWCIFGVSPTYVRSGLYAHVSKQMRGRTSDCDALTNLQLGYGTGSSPLCLYYRVIHETKPTTEHNPTDSHDDSCEDYGRSTSLRGIPLAVCIKCLIFHISFM